MSELLISKTDGMINRMKKTLIILIVAVIAVAVFAVTKKPEEPEEPEVPGVATSTSPTTSLTTSSEEQAKEDVSILLDTKDWQTYTNDKHGVGLKYPPKWTANEFVYQKSTVVEFYPPGPKADIEYSGDIVVSLISNPGGLDIQRFYNGDKNVDLFADALGGQVEVKVGVRSGIKFLNVKGIVSHTIAVISLPEKKIMLELTDAVGRHLEDGIFDAMLYSIKLD